MSAMRHTSKQEDNFLRIQMRNTALTSLITWSYQEEVFSYTGLMRGRV